MLNMGIRMWIIYKFNRKYIKFYSSRQFYKYWKTSSFFVLSNKEKSKLVNNIYRETPQNNKAIYEKGLVSSCIYIVKDGSVTLNKDGDLLSKGECFWALEVIANGNRITDAIPSGRTTLCNIPVFWIKALYGDNYRSVVTLALIKLAFQIILL